MGLLTFIQIRWQREETTRKVALLLKPPISLRMRSEMAHTWETSERETARFTSVLIQGRDLSKDSLYSRCWQPCLTGEHI